MPTILIDRKTYKILWVGILVKLTECSQNAAGIYGLMYTYHFKDDAMIYDINDLIRQEVLFPKALAKTIITDYGVLFLNEDCPLSYDTNHAVITRLDYDLSSALDDAVSFFEARSIQPRIYYAGIPGELDILKPYLEDKGFELEIRDGTSFYVYENIKVEIPTAGLTFKRVTEPDKDLDEVLMSGADEVKEVIDSGMGGLWWKTFMHQTLKAEDIHMLVGYKDGKPVTMASVNIMDGYSRIDDVKTHTSHWNKGYSSALMAYLVDYHKSISNNLLYLFAYSPAALRVYEKTGFVKIHSAPLMWSAWQE